MIDKYGPWAVITGASEGVGAEFALRLADEGISSILIARREGPLAELAAKVRAKGVECVTACVDLTALDATDKIAAIAGDREVGLLIANAGADTFVAGSAIFGTPDYKATITAMRAALAGVV